MTLDQLAHDWPLLTLDQLVQDWPTLTEEQCIEIGVTLATAIVRPEQWKGYVFEPRTRWQHVDGCRARIAWALRQVAGPIDPSEIPPAGGGGKEHRENRRRKEVAAMLFGDIMLDFGSCGWPTKKRMAARGAFSELVTIAFAVATGPPPAMRIGRWAGILRRSTPGVGWRQYAELGSPDGQYPLDPPKATKSLRRNIRRFRPIASFCTAEKSRSNRAL